MVNNISDKKSLTPAECAELVRQASIFVKTTRNSFEVADNYSLFSPAYLHEKRGLESRVNDLELKIGAVANARTGRDLSIAFNKLSEAIAATVEARNGKSSSLNITSLLEDYRLRLNGGKLGIDNDASKNMFLATRATDDSSIKLSQFSSQRRNIETPKFEAQELAEFKRGVNSWPTIRAMAEKAASQSQNR